MGFTLKNKHKKEIEDSIKLWDDYPFEEERYLFEKGWIQYDMDFWEGLGYKYKHNPLDICLKWFEFNNSKKLLEFGFFLEKMKNSELSLEEKLKQFLSIGNKIE